MTKLHIEHTLCFMRLALMPPCVVKSLPTVSTVGLVDLIPKQNFNHLNAYASNASWGPQKLYQDLQFIGINVCISNANGMLTHN